MNYIWTARAAWVRTECNTATRGKRALKRATVWGVRAISGTRTIDCLPSVTARAIARR